jgi:hypothetical protein
MRYGDGGLSATTELLVPGPCRGLANGQEIRGVVIVLQERVGLRPSAPDVIFLKIQYSYIIPQSRYDSIVPMSGCLGMAKPVTY